MNRLTVRILWEPSSELRVFSPLRRAHLKECFETLKKNVPNVDEKKTSNLSVLRSALRYIQVESDRLFPSPSPLVSVGCQRTHQRLDIICVWMESAQSRELVSGRTCVIIGQCVKLDTSDCDQQPFWTNDRESENPVFQCNLRILLCIWEY